MSKQPRPARTHDRQAAVLFRVSKENRELLKQRAQLDGYATLQDWMDAKLLGDRAPKHNQEGLPLTTAS